MTDATHPGFSAIERAPEGDGPALGVGMVGYDFMGRAHANAYRKIPYVFWPPPARLQLVALCGRTRDRVAAAARRYGFDGYYTDWRALVADPRIDLVDNCAWHDAHAEPCIAAVEAGKHVLCEKPLALTAADARRMRDAAAAAGVKHMTSFNYRFAPAVALARDVVERGLLGRVHHVRVSYLQDHQADPEKPYPWAGRPSGVLLGLGSHVIDLARFLVGEIRSVNGYVRTFNNRRPLPDDAPSTALPASFAGGARGGRRMIDVTDDDAALAQVEFSNGALGTLEAAWVCAGRKNQLAFEINGSKGSLAWDLEDLNRLHAYLEGADKIEGTRGFENVLVTEAHHPHHQVWWPFGHILGWEHLHVNLIHHFVRAVATGEPAEP